MEKYLKLKVIKAHGYLQLVNEERKTIGHQTDIKIQSQLGDRNKLKVSVDFILDIEDLEL